jgi:hypothetical protein
MYEDITQQLILTEIERSRLHSQTTQRDELELSFDRICQSLAEQKEKMRTDLEAHDVKIKEAVLEHEEHWNAESEEFDRETDRDIPPLHKKFSQTLLTLKETERWLRRTRRFEEAGYARMELAEREEFEIKELRKAWEKTRETQKINKSDAHLKKIACLKEDAARRRRKIEARYLREIERMEHAKRNLEIKIKELENEIRDTVSSAPSGLPEHPGSVARSKIATFVTQQQTSSSTTSRNQRSQSKQTVKVVYRPFFSKWRIKSPQSMAPGLKV